jgi:hypothetical protein
MHAQGSNIGSAKDTAIVPNMQASNQLTNNVYTNCHAITGNIGLDQIGGFIVPSTSGNTAYSFSMTTTAIQYKLNSFQMARKNQSKLPMRKSFVSYNHVDSIHNYINLITKHPNS